jgi:hypothetical protein
MSRTLSSEMQAVATAEVVRPIYLIDMAFSASTVRLWSGLGDLTAPVGSNLVTNGTFTGNANGWNLVDFGTGETIYIDNEIRETGINFANRATLRQDIPTIAGQKYIVQYDASGITHIVIRDMVGNVNIVQSTSKQAGTPTQTFTAASSSTRIDIRNQNGGTVVIDNVEMYTSQTYVGAGDLLKISEIQETADLQANGANVTLSGCNATLINLAQNEDYQGRLMTISLGAFDGSGNVIASPAVLFTGFMDVMTISDGGQFSSINVSVENKLIAFERAYVRRYTDNDQKIEYPTDDGFEYVTSIQELEIIWGRNTPAAQPTAGIAGREGLRTGRGNRG